jgi:hypothetical protein
MSNMMAQDMDKHNYDSVNTSILSNDPNVKQGSTNDLNLHDYYFEQKYNAFTR